MFLSDFYRGKRVLITGHTGFKGSWLSYWLHLLGADIYGFALAPDENSLFNQLNLTSLIQSRIDDIRNYKSISQYIEDVKPEIVFHLAAQALVRRSYEDPILTFSTNVMGSLNLLEAIRHNNMIKSLVFITSDKCYWNSEWVWGYRETDPLGGADPYSASKACAEHVFKSYYLSYFKNKENFGCASTRAGNVIGGGDYSDNRIIPDIVRSLEKKQNINLRNPNATRPWQHVLDPLHGYLMLGKRLFENPNQYNGEAWNFGPTSQSIKTVLELSESLLKSLNGSDAINIDCNTEQSALYESTLLHLSIDKSQTLLDWFPVYQFNDSVDKTGCWYRDNVPRVNTKEITKIQIEEFMNKRRIHAKYSGI